jgi:hypothetical protein
MSVPFICFLVVAALVVAAIVVFGIRFGIRRRKARNDIACVTNELYDQFLQLKNAHASVRQAALPRWLELRKDDLLKETRGCLITAERALENARKTSRAPSPSAKENLAAVENVIGAGEHALFSVMDATTIAIKTANKQLDRFRNKMHRHLVSAFGADAMNEHVRIVDELGHRIAWNVGEGRVLKSPLFTMAIMIASAGRLSAAITSLGEQRKWQNGLINFRIDAAMVRLVIVQQVRDALRAIHAFRTLRRDHPGAAWDAVVAEKGGVITGGGIHRIKLFLTDAKRYLIYRSREQEEILAEIISAETMLMGYEGALMEALDPQSEAETEHAKAQAGQTTWGLDIHRSAQRVA